MRISVSYTHLDVYKRQEKRIVRGYVVKHTGNAKGYRNNQCNTCPCHNGIEHTGYGLFRHALITLGEIWITELDGVPKNTLNNDNFTSDDKMCIRDRPQPTTSL